MTTKYTFITGFRSGKTKALQTIKRWFGEEGTASIRLDMSGQALDAAEVMKLAMLTSHLGGWVGRLVSFDADVSLLSRTGSIRQGRTRLILEHFTGSGRVLAESADPYGLIVNVQMPNHLGQTPVLVEWARTHTFEVEIHPDEIGGPL
jgi:hypothetical protein